MYQNSLIGLADHFNDYIPLEQREPEWFFQEYNMPDNKTHEYDVYWNKIKVNEVNPQIINFITSKSECIILSHTDNCKFYISIQIKYKGAIIFFIIEPKDDFIEQLQYCHVINLGNWEDEWIFDLPQPTIQRISENWDNFNQEKNSLIL